MERMAFPPGRYFLPQILISVPGWKTTVLAAIRAQDEELNGSDHSAADGLDGDLTPQNGGAAAANEIEVFSSNHEG